MSPLSRHALFHAAFKTIRATRADRWLRPVARGRGVILTFHHVRPFEDRAFAPNRLLEITPGFLDRVLTVVREEGFGLVPLDAVPGLLADPDAPPFAALTFDDGYRDNRDHAAPILRRHGAPWTLFVVSDYAAGRGRLWWVELEEAVRRLDRIRIDLEDGAIDLPARTDAEKRAAFAAVYARLRAGPEERLRDAIAGLAAQAGVDPEDLVRGLCLSFDELGAMADEPGLTLGAHTLSHPMLAKHSSEVAAREIGESRALVEARLGRAVSHLAYPVGDPGSAGPRDFALAREAGFSTAVTTRPGHLFPEHLAHLHALPRVSVNGLFQTDDALRALLSGVPFLAWNRGRRLKVG